VWRHHVHAWRGARGEDGAAILAPQLSAAPAHHADGMLRLTGFFPSRPLQINLALKFQVVANQWRIFAIAIPLPAPPVTKGCQEGVGSVVSDRFVQNVHCGAIGKGR